MATIAPTRPKSVFEGRPLPSLRNIEQGELSLPPDTIVVSADDHWSVAEDIFYRGFPAHLRDRAPRVFFDQGGFCRWEIGGKSVLPQSTEVVSAEFECVPGAREIEPRMEYLDAARIDKEIVFGNGVHMFLNFGDSEVREWVYRIYNEHLAEQGRKAPGRFYGVGFINYWDKARTRESIAELKACGLKTFMLPISPKDGSGGPLNYCAPEMDYLWSAIEEADLPVCFHVGESFADGPGGIATTSMVLFGPFRKNLSELIFGGIFDRHPGLQVVFVEADINWIPGALQHAEYLYESFNDKILDPKIKHNPSYYWHSNCYATFMHDPVGMRLLDIVGTDRVMWSSDYPHVESTYGGEWSSMKEVIDAVTPDEARMILGGTAMKVFRL